MIDPSELQFGTVVNLFYLLTSGGGLAYGVKLRNDVRHDLTVAASTVNGRTPDPRDIAIVRADLRRETMRLAKHALVFLVLLMPLVFRPVLADRPDPVIFEMYRATFALIGAGLLWNSYSDLRFRREMRRRFAKPPATA